MLLVFTCIFWLCLAYNLALQGAPYLAGPFSFSIILYVLLIYLIRTKDRGLIMYVAVEKYRKQKLENTQANKLIEELNSLMEKEEVYLKADLKMPLVAQSISSSTHDLSQALNGHLGLSFNDYINQLRIKKACELLQTQHHLTIEGIGKEVGFNSRSAFYTAFKNVKGQTPGQFKKQIDTILSK
ncbi:MAG: helix-turn-helix domain-containing protein [Bacteroidota bacterium]